MDIVRFNSICIKCIYNKFLKAVPENTEEIKKLNYLKGILRIMGEAENSVSAPEIVAACTQYKNDIFGVIDDFKELKTYFNKLMLGYEDSILKRIEESKDSVRSAICYALLGNYIDFGAMDRVDESKLKALIENAEGMNIDKTELENIKEDLKNSKTLVYLTDNCGEIVLDKLFIKEIKKNYPLLNIKVIVRGENVLNDATLFDAEEVGLTDTATVIGNGTGIAGTCIDRLPEEIRKTVLGADMIIAKGQGNFETLCYSKRNIYYLFMCKCKMFADRFNVEPLSPMILNDLRMK